MGVRRINPLEQHIEKIVVGIAGASLLGIFAWQFVGGPTTISVGKDGDVPIAGAYVKLEEQAAKLKGAISTENPEIPLANIGPGLFAEFSGKYRSAIPEPLRRGPWTGDAVRSLVGGDGGQSAAQGPVHVPTIPAVTALIAHPFMSIIDQSEITSAPELAALLPKAEPFDRAAVSIEGRFNGVRFRELLELDPDGAGPIRSVPRNWWENRSAVLAVELVRQQRQPDGAWSKEQLVPPAPGRSSLVPRIVAIKGMSDMEEVLGLALGSEENVLRPEWYRRPDIGGQLVGEEWVAPSDATAALDDAASKDPRQLVRQQTDIQRRLTAAETKLTRLQQSPASPSGGKGGGRISGPAAPGTKGGPNAGEIAVTERTIAKLKDELKAVADKLAAIGLKPDVAPLVRPSTTTAAASVLTSSDLQLWAHDITVERGQTYRYQLRVLIGSPFFSRGSVGADQAELTKRPYLTSADSAWTEPVTVDEEHPFFITTAQAGTAGSRGAQAKAELFTFSWGYWRKADVAMEPGDMVAGSTIIPDYEKIRQMAQSMAPGESGGPGAVPPVSPGAEGGQAGKGKDKGKPADRQPSKPLPISRDTFMLDVATLLDTTPAVGNSGTRISFQAYLRDLGGRIISRQPDRDRTSIAYRRLNASAVAGQNAQIRPEDLKAPTTPRPNDPEPVTPPGRPGGGGGGGGG